jgi:Flp pilus assembly protein TadG
MDRVLANLRRAPKEASRGAVAVEAAVVIPLLLVLVLSMVDFGRFFFAQLTARQAVTESSRALAFGQEEDFGLQIAESMLAGAQRLSGGGALSYSSTPCPNQATINGSGLATASVSFPFEWITPLSLLAEGGSGGVLPPAVSQSSQSVCRV